MQIVVFRRNAWAIIVATLHRQSVQCHSQRRIPANGMKQDTHGPWTNERQFLGMRGSHLQAIISNIRYIDDFGTTPLIVVRNAWLANTHMIGLQHQVVMRMLFVEFSTAIEPSHV